jgi:hypothetical protein
MSEMVERVVEAIASSGATDPMWDDETVRMVARAAIAAMREPTEEMKRAGFENSPHDVGGCSDQISKEDWREEICPEIYQAMIDAALKED